MHWFHQSRSLASSARLEGPIWTSQERSILYDHFSGPGGVSWLSGLRVHINSTGNFPTRMEKSGQSSRRCAFLTLWSAQGGSNVHTWNRLQEKGRLHVKRKILNEDEHTSTVYMTDCMCLYVFMDTWYLLLSPVVIQRWSEGPTAARKHNPVQTGHGVT